MSNSSHNTPGVEVGLHPQWCDRAECLRTAEGDVCHRSTPQRIEFRDCSAAIWLQAGEEAAHSGQPWTVEATVRITPALTWPDGSGDLYLQPEEMLRLADRIATERQRALLLSSPAGSAS